MIKGIVAAAALTGSLIVGPAALAAPVDPIGTAPGYGLEHAGHDHAPEPERPRPRPDKRHDEHHDKRHDHRHGHGDSAHAGGGYDSHRSHPRDW
jgi:hypothetical protein